MRFPLESSMYYSALSPDLQWLVMHYILQAPCIPKNFCLCHTPSTTPPHGFMFAPDMTKFLDSVTNPDFPSLSLKKWHTSLVTNLYCISQCIYRKAFKVDFKVIHYNQPYIEFKG